MAKVFQPDAERLRQIGYASVCHVPVVFDSSWRYEGAINQHLRERALLKWHPAGTPNPISSRHDFPVQKTLVNLANCLKNFLEWCERRRVDWRVANYEQVMVYQADMIEGRWSSKGVPLEFDTANTRADAATHFLLWASERRLRSEFRFPVRTSERLITSGAITATVLRGARAGKIRSSTKKGIRKLVLIPTAREIRDWLHTVRARRGYAKQLAARFLVETGVRREEVAAVNVDQLLSRSELDLLTNRGQFVAPMYLTKTKGSKPRTIQVPLPLASELRQWADGKRLTLAYRFQKRTGERPSDALFLSDSAGYEGIPLSGATIYSIFGVSKPVPTWCPHKARHAFACLYVLEALETEARVQGMALPQMTADWLTQRGSWWICTLRKQLGHISEDTTDIYLGWLLTMSKVGEAATGWHRFLAGDEPESK